MKIAYEKNGVIITETFTQEIEINFPYVVIDREISEPIESWYIENSEIKFK